MTNDIAHAARIEDGIVQQVIVMPYCNDDDAEITAYCNSLGLEGEWLDTSYHGKRRGKYAAVGDRYDAATDQFAPVGWEWVDGEWVDPDRPTSPPEPWP